MGIVIHAVNGGLFVAKEDFRHPVERVVLRLQLSGDLRVCRDAFDPPVDDRGCQADRTDELCKRHTLGNAAGQIADDLIDDRSTALDPGDIAQIFQVGQRVAYCCPADAKHRGNAFL